MSDPVADFLAREQGVLAGIDDYTLDVAPLEGALINGPDFVNNFVGAVDSELHTHEQRSVDQTATWMSTGTTPSPLTVGSSPKIEPEKIKKWREDQKEVLERKDAEEEKKKNEMRATAKKEMSDWYNQREDRLVKTKMLNRKAEEEFIADRDSVKEGAEWERIAKLCDFNVKNSKSASDLSRLRSLLLQLKGRKE
ncbi:unnamed protein product [Dracunculus medinensis]|uniref:Clathrin light chain n=1 Tax=Dracunculus medinensis TaxID=318479 RepID=A0A0N4UNP4_DRAME|nr:unnamed protein product [Dracunculus medinensis]